MGFPDAVVYYLYYLVFLATNNTENSPGYQNTEETQQIRAKAALRMDQGIGFPEPEAAGAKYYGNGIQRMILACTIFGKDMTG